MPINHSEIASVILIPARVGPRRLEIHPVLKALNVSLKKWKKQKKRCSHNQGIECPICSYFEHIAWFNLQHGFLQSISLCPLHR